MTETDALDIAVALTHASVVALPAAWLTLGVLDNLRYPENNRDTVRRILDLDPLRDWPEVEARMRHRRAADPELSARRLFAVVVAVEALVCIGLWAGVAGLLAALAGAADPRDARALAVVAVLGFTSIWAGFLIGGQRYLYWYGDCGQSTHFYMLLWGLATIVVLMV